MTSQLSHIERSDNCDKTGRSRPTQQHRGRGRREGNRYAEAFRQADRESTGQEGEDAPERNAWESADCGPNRPERESRCEQDARSGYRGDDVKAKLRAQPCATNPRGSVTSILACDGLQTAEGRSSANRQHGQRSKRGNQRKDAPESAFDSCAIHLYQPRTSSLFIRRCPLPIRVYGQPTHSVTERSVALAAPRWPKCPSSANGSMLPTSRPSTNVLCRRGTVGSPA